MKPSSGLRHTLTFELRSPLHTPVQGRGWPLSGEEEEALVWELMGFAAAVPWTTRDAHLIVGAIHAGATLDSLSSYDVRLAPLYEAYLAVEARLRAIQDAWARVGGHVGAAVAPNTTDLDVIAVFLPHPAIDLGAALNEGPDWEAARDIVRTVETITAYITAQETKILSGEPGPEDRLAILHATPEGVGGMWEHDAYLPQRVGSISPTRLHRLIDRTPTG